MATLVSRIESRQGAIDFLPTPLLIESAYIVYRLPKEPETGDTTYINIFKREFLLSMVGPLILTAVTAAVVHVTKLSCTEPEPQQVSFRNIKKLLECTENICFHHRKDYQGQATRILRASWSIFCLIIVSAYSAYLVTTYTINPNELKIRTFQDLLRHEEFSFGMHGSSKALPIIMKNSTDIWLQKTWARLVEFNKSNPLTFSLDLGYHVKRVTESRYVFLDNFSVGSGEFYDYLPGGHKDIVAYPQNDMQGLTSSYIAIPKHVYFKDLLYRFQLKLEESGIIIKLQTIYFSRNSSLDRKKAISEDVRVSFHRVELIIYISLGGICFSFLLLAAECVLSWWTRRVNS